MTTDTSTHSSEHSQVHPHDGAHTGDETALFGIWVYIMSDCLLFASLFATYAVLRGATFGGPSLRTFVNMPFVLTESLILLASSFTYGLVTLYAHHHNSKAKVLASLGVTFLLGCGFVAMEMSEFVKLIHDGSGPDRSAFLSAFFALLGTHGLHVLVGLIWMGLLFVQVVFRGVTPTTVRKLSSLGLFWHFLDIVWIFIFTIVYLMGVL